jgi:hypothetical protein
MMLFAQLKNKDLQRCQVATPYEIVDLAWRIARSRRPGRKFSSVLDLGAGDARFSRARDAFSQYVGVELDRTRSNGVAFSGAIRIVHADAMHWRDSGYALSIGNPPFIKFHHLEPVWREEVLGDIERQSGVRLKRTANLFSFFLMQALLRTAHDGLVVQIVPYEWVTRPSTEELRAYIRDNGWDVTDRTQCTLLPTQRGQRGAER